MRTPDRVARPRGSKRAAPIRASNRIDSVGLETAADSSSCESRVCETRRCETRPVRPAWVTDRRAIASHTCSRSSSRDPQFLRHGRHAIHRHTVRSIGAWLFAIVALSWGAFSWSSIALADRFVLKDGRRLEGEIVRELGDLVSIRTTDGEVVTIDRREIRSQIEERTVQEDYAEKSAALADDDIDGHRKLAKWCGENQLEAERSRHYRRVIELSPFDEEARVALGYALIGGDWYLEGSDEAERRRAEIETLSQMPKKIPDDFEVVDLSGSNATGGIAGGAGGSGSLGPVKGNIQLFARERVGPAPPEQSHVAWRLNPITRSFDDPLGVLPVEDKEKVRDGLLLEVKVRVYFVRTTMFYGKIPLNNVYQGEVDGTLYDVEDGEWKVVDRFPSFRFPFSASAQLPREEGFKYAYIDTVAEFAERFSKWGWARRKGCEPLKPRTF